MRRAALMIGVALVFLAALTPRSSGAQETGAAGVPDVATAAFERLVTDEPGALEVQRAALRAAGWSTLPDGSWIRAARSTAALPTVTLDVGWRGVSAGRQERTDTLDTAADALGPDQTERAVRRDDAATQVDAGLRLQWDLRPAAWSTLEQSAIGLVFDAAGERLALLEAANEAYFARRAALWAALHAGTALEEMEARAAFERATATLDALTDGWFSQAVGRGGSAAP